MPPISKRFYTEIGLMAVVTLPVDAKYTLSATPFPTTGGSELRLCMVSSFRNVWCGSWYNSDWRVGTKPADKTRMGHRSTSTESPSGLCCYGAFEFRPIPNTQHKI